MEFIDLVRQAAENIKLNPLVPVMTSGKRVVISTEGGERSTWEPPQESGCVTQREEVIQTPWGGQVTLRASFGKGVWELTGSQEDVRRAHPLLRSIGWSPQGGWQDSQKRGRWYQERPSESPQENPWEDWT